MERLRRAHANRPALPSMGRGRKRAPDFDIDSIRLNALRNFRAGMPIRPFVTVGLGQESIDAESLLNEDEVGFNAGGGCRWFLNDHFGFRLVRPEDVEEARREAEAAQRAELEARARAADDPDRAGVPAIPGETGAPR